MSRLRVNRSFPTRKTNRSECCIGILTIPHTKKTKHTSHIMKSYVDWFERQGIHVLPIPFDTPHPDLYFHSVQGLFLPGTDRGYDVQSPPFMNCLKRFIELSLREYFPIWGTCFGMEALVEAIGGAHTWKPYPAEGLGTIRMTREATKSTLIQSFSSRMIHELENRKCVVQNHDYGISMEDLKANATLRRFFRVTATSLDSTGKEYVAAMEAKHYPIYAFQFHPEEGSLTKAPFLDFLHSELKHSQHRCHVALPPVRHVAKLGKCVQYDGKKAELCYFF